MTKEQREKVLLDIYSENQKFIDKITITASLGSIPLSLSLIEKIVATNLWGIIFFISINVLSITVIALQIIGALYGKKTCDISLNEDSEQGQINKYNQRQNFCNFWVNLSFILLLICYIALIITLSIYYRYVNGTFLDNKQKNNPEEIVMKTNSTAVIFDSPSVPKKVILNESPSIPKVITEPQPTSKPKS